jgi:hypothetical protein
MDKSLLVFIAIGVAFIYFITNFVGDIQKEDEKFRNTGYEQKHQYDAYMGKDSIGRDILDLTSASPAIQMKVWNSSQLKEEMLANFPDFSLMKLFVKERVRGEEFQEKLLKHIDHVELQYFSGKLDPENAKRALEEFK